MSTIPLRDLSKQPTDVLISQYDEASTYHGRNRINGDGGQTPLQQRINKIVEMISARADNDDPVALAWYEHTPKTAEGPVYEAMFLQWVESTSMVDISTVEGLEDAVDRFFASEGISANKQDLIDSVTRNQVPRPGAFVLGQKSSEFIPSVSRHVSGFTDLQVGDLVRMYNPQPENFNLKNKIGTITRIWDEGYTYEVRWRSDHLSGLYSCIEIKKIERNDTISCHVSQVVETCGGCFKATWDQISDNYIRVAHPTEVSYNVHKDPLAIDEINKATMDTLQSGQGSPCSRHNNI